MTEKETFDAWMKLAELKSNIREKRREIEWKVSIGLWAVTGGAVAYLKGRPISWSLLILLVVVFMHSWLWVKSHYHSSERDAKMIYFYMLHAQKIVLPESVKLSDLKLPNLKFKPWEFLKHKPIWFEIAMTPVLGLLVILAAR